MTVACGKVGLQEVVGGEIFAAKFKRAGKMPALQGNTVIVLSILICIASSDLSRTLKTLLKSDGKGT
jgi:hypothetical protein